MDTLLARYPLGQIIFVAVSGVVAASRAHGEPAAGGQPGRRERQEGGNAGTALIVWFAVAVLSPLRGFICHNGNDINRVR
jgi:hypothetical protein